MALAEGKAPVTSSYIESVSLSFSAWFASCRSRLAFVFAFFLAMMITITVIETTTLTIKAAAKTLIDIMHTLLVSGLFIPNITITLSLLSVTVGLKMLTFIVLLNCPVMFPQATGCTANVHRLPLLCTLVQVTLVWLVVVGHPPQFDLMLKWSKIAAAHGWLQVKTILFSELSTL